MDRSKDQPTTSKRQIVGGINNEPASRRKVRREQVNKKEKRKIQGPRGEIEVDLNPGDIIVTLTRRDGTVIQSVDRRKAQSSGTSKKNQSVRKTQTSQSQKPVPNQTNQTNQASSTTQKPKQEVQQQDNMTPYEHWYRQNFIKSYIKAYKGEGKETDPPLSWYNEQLRNLKDPEGVWREIWKGIDPNHTQELSDAQHEMFYTINPGTKDAMGQTNWYNMFSGNLLQATADDVSIPRSSLDYVSPEQRSKTIYVTNPGQLTQPVDEIDALIRQNSDLFESQYNYAREHNGAFDYNPSSFDATRLNVNYKYGGIGDFMSAYGLNPQGLYKRLEGIYGS